MRRLDWANSSVLVTGGTGSFGTKFVELALAELEPRRLAVFSRDELKQEQLRRRYPDVGASPVRYLIGDVRDRERLNRALQGVDVVIHAAAMKQVPACEYNPFEAVQTNILGARNVIDAAINEGVSRVLAVSTDKAVNPVNLYGATKLVAEKLFVQGSVYVGRRTTAMSSVRYGNVIGSRGSVIPLFLEQRRSGRLTITDPSMTRFWLPIEQGVRFVIRCVEMMKGGEIFVPKIPSMKVADIAEAIGPDCEKEVIGIRPGEKRHEVLISADEARYTVDLGDMFVIRPDNPWAATPAAPEYGARVEAGFSFSSDSNELWLSRADIIALIEDA